MESTRRRYRRGPAALSSCFFGAAFIIAGKYSPWIPRSFPSNRCCAARGSVLAVAVCRSLQLPPMIGYLVTGLPWAPRAGWCPTSRNPPARRVRRGVPDVSIGSNSACEAARDASRGVRAGLAQVAATMALALGARLRRRVVACGAHPRRHRRDVLDPMVSKLLAERLELDTAHGRQVIGMLLFRTSRWFLAGAAPALDQSADALGAAVAIALGKAVLALAVVITLGPKLMRAGWNRRPPPLERAVRPERAARDAAARLRHRPRWPVLVLGRFLAGMLISETGVSLPGRGGYQALRDVLLGLFFVTVGMMLDLRLVLGEFRLVMLLFVLLVGAKFALIALLASAFGSAPGTRCASGSPWPGGRIRLRAVSLAAPTRVVPEPCCRACSPP